MTMEAAPRTPTPSAGGRQRTYRIERRFDGSRPAREMITALIAAHNRVQ